MTELEILLFGKPHPVPVYVPTGNEMGYFGKRCSIYGKVTGLVEEEARKMLEFTVNDIASNIKISRATVNRALVRLAKEGKVSKVKTQSGGCGRKSAVWACVSPSQGNG